jgi:hypothetical protein
VEFLGASASEWVNGGIRILPGTKGEMKQLSAVCQPGKSD